MNLSHRELIQFCSEILETYSQHEESVDYHLTEFLKTVPSMDDRDETFVEEVFTGCVRFEPVLTVVVDGFYNRDGKFVLRAEESTYQVISYLILFRAEELGISHLKKFVESLDFNKMLKFLTFLLDEKNMRTWMKDAWNRHYDAAFVEETILAPLLKLLPELLKLPKSLRRLIENAKSPKKMTIPSVEPKPFNLTQPKPIKIPIPERIPKLTYYRPAPESTCLDRRTDVNFQKTKERNFKLAQKLHDEANKLSPSCAAKTEKSEKVKLRMKEYAEKENKKLNFNQRYSNPPPTSMLTEVVPIKLNAAAILREGKLYQRREEEEIKRFEKLEAGYGDAAEFNEWQTKMRQIDLERDLMEAERRRLDGQLCKEEAIVAKQKLTQENRDKANEMRAQAEKYMQEFFKQRLVEEEHTRKLVEKVVSAHENAREAKIRLQQYKAKIVQDMIEESRELMRQALEEAEVVMKQKMELINQIKEMESGRAIHQRLFDLTETSGCGLLCEMSIAELRERLRLLKMEEAEQEEMKRNEIQVNKQLKEQMLMETIETIARHRTEQSKAIANRNEERRKSTEKKKPKDESLIKMEQMIEERKAQRFRDRELAKYGSSSKQVQRSKSTDGSKKLPEEVDTWNSGYKATVSQIPSTELPKTSAGNSRSTLLAF